MSSYRSHRRWVIWLTFLVALVLQMMPWPNEIYLLRPSWLQLVLIYWVMALPHRTSVGTAFVLGLLYDLTLASTLGIRALIFSLLAYVVAYKSQLLRNMALWQQALVVMALSLLSNLLIYIFELFIHHVPFHGETFVVSLINAVLWPWIFLLLRKIRRQFSVR